MRRLVLQKGMTVHQNELTWRKSKRSGAAGHCVEIAETPAAVLVRDSKDTSGPVLEFAATGWEGFLAGVRDGEFDRPGA
jgi:predicted secreted Zn-dependent protease